MVSPVDSENIQDLYFLTIPDELEKSGKPLFWASSLISLSVFIPAATKKKRVYQPLFLNNGPILADRDLSPPDELPSESDAKTAPLFPSCTLDERAKVDTLFSKTASLSLIGLGWNKNELEQLGKDVDRVHTFPFLLAIPKKSMQTIFKKHNRWVVNEIVAGIRKGIERELSVNQIEPYIPTFAEKMGKDPKEIRRYIESSNYESLICYLFDI